MSTLDIRALETNFENWRRDRAPLMKASDAFERYSIEQILKDSELSDEEIESGILGGGDDGGVDGMYFFVNNVLIQDGTMLPDPALTAELFLVQAKFENGFGETAVDKMYSFTRDLLDYSKSVDQISYLNSVARDAISLFRDNYDKILGSANLTVRYYYATKSDSQPNLKVTEREKNLKNFVRSKLSQAIYGFAYWGCKNLLVAARSAPQQKLAIRYTKYFDTNDGCVGALVELKNFAEFLKNDKGELRRGILEPNVRDYQGKSNPVNIDIRRTLNSTDEETEFWWLNNGITILATDCSISAGKLVITQPEIVNGLQTTQEIFAHFLEFPKQQDSRNVLIRIIVPPKEETRNKIIKATNNQTPVNVLSLHATEPIHFNIEERLKLYGLFYDRRKGHYRQLRKPISQTVSQLQLARSVIAILLRQPDEARGRPQTLVNKQTIYEIIFNERYNPELYVTCILLDRKVEEYLGNRTDISKDERRDARFYMDTLVACELTQSAEPAPDKLAALVQTLVEPISEQIMSAACQEVLTTYRALVKKLLAKRVLGAGDKVAKGTELRTKLLAALAARYPAPAKHGVRSKK